MKFVKKSFWKYNRQLDLRETFSTVASYRNLTWPRSTICPRLFWRH